MKKGIFIGINHYKNKPLKGCVNDAQELASCLNWSYCADSPDNLKENIMTEVLVSDSSNKNPITKPLLKQKLIAFFADDNCELAIIFFSGHGFHDQYGGYLVTEDTISFDEGLPMNDVLTLANNSNIKEILIILDCCFSGHMGELFIVDNRFAALRKGVSILTSSNHNEVSFESSKNKQGLFTEALINALSGEASDLFGNIDTPGLYNHVSKLFWETKQKPNLKSNISSPSRLKKVRPRIAPELLKDLIHIFPNPEFHLKLSPEFEPSCKPKNLKAESVFEKLLIYRDNGLVRSVNSKYMFYAAQKSLSCALTDLGKLYWKLIKSKLT